MWLAVLSGVAGWAAWALTARALYRRWAAQEWAVHGAQGSYGLICFAALAFALLLPLALAVVVIHAVPRPAPDRERL